jgi:hypothetical protein
VPLISQSDKKERFFEVAENLNELMHSNFILLGGKK